MRFSEAVTTCFEKYGSFSGRAARSEYWYFVLFSLLVAFATSVLDSMSFGVPSTNRPFQGFSMLALSLPAMSAAARRLHDLDRTALWLLPGLTLWLYSMSVRLVFRQPNFSSLGREGSIAITVLFVGIFLCSIGVQILMMLKGTTGPNRFGSDPLADDATPTPSTAPAI